MNVLHEILNQTTREMFLNKDFFDWCELNQVRPTDWPDCRAKEIALEYAKARISIGHAMASVQLSGYLAEVRSESIGMDLDIFLAEYQTSLKEHRAVELAQKILREPLSADKFIAGFAMETTRIQMTNFGEKMEDIYRESVRLFQIGESLRTIKGWENLSAMLGGFNPGRISMLLAQTGFGKSTAAINIGLAAARTHKVAYFNMEMLPQDFGEKLLLSTTKSDFIVLKKAPESLLNRVADNLLSARELSFKYSDGRAVSIAEIVAVCRKLKREEGLDYVFIDYDQKIKLNLKREEKEWMALRDAMEALEEMSKELSCYTMVLAQEDSEGDVAASKRSKQPTSTVIRFYLNDYEQFVMEAIKNRFGKHKDAIEVIYEPEKSHVAEKGRLDGNETRRRESQSFGGSKEASKGVGPGKGNLPNHARRQFGPD